MYNICIRVYIYIYIYIYIQHIHIYVCIYRLGIYAEGNLRLIPLPICITSRIYLLQLCSLCMSVSCGGVKPLLFFGVLISLSVCGLSYNVLCCAAAAAAAAAVAAVYKQTDCCSCCCFFLRHDCWGYNWRSAVCTQRPSSSSFLRIHLHPEVIIIIYFFSLLSLFCCLYWL